MKKNYFILFFIFILSVVIYAERPYEPPKRINYTYLPKAAQTFIETYFNDYNYLYAYESSFYKAHFKGNIIIVFDLAGNWIDVAGNGEEIPTGYIDEKILKAVSTKNTNSKITKISRKKNKFEAKLVNGTKMTMDTEGNIKKVSSKKR